jgi:hypothetical protein
MALVRPATPGEIGFDSMTKTARGLGFVLIAALEMDLNY